MIHGQKNIKLLLGKLLAFSFLCVLQLFMLVSNCVQTASVST